MCKRLLSVTSSARVWSYTTTFILQALNNNCCILVQNLHSKVMAVSLYKLGMLALQPKPV